MEAGVVDRKKTEEALRHNTAQRLALLGDQWPPAIPGMPAGDPQQWPPPVQGVEPAAPQAWNPAGVVAIGFLTRANISLWEVWDEFFRGDETKSFVPLVHTQTKKRSELSLLQGWVGQYEGRIVDSDRTRYGDLRFDFNMVTAMFELARLADNTWVGGRRVSWIHFASERCAPIRPASAVLEFLNSRDSISHMDEDPFTAAGKQTIPSKMVPKEFQPLIMTSQWTTMWLPDAMAIANKGPDLWKK